MKQTKIIFFGNGPLADYSLEVLGQSFNIIFHAKTASDLEIVKELKSKNQDAYGILASFGVLIKKNLLDLFEPTGILNIHPSLLPHYRGASPIETAILNGDQDFSISIMKLVKTMDAGPIYYQSTIKNFSSNPPTKQEIYQKLAHLGANWLTENILNLPYPIPQDDSLATFTTKFDKSMSKLDPSKKAIDLLNQIRAFDGFPKSKFTFFNTECIILKAHISNNQPKSNQLFIDCSDDFLIIDELQPTGRRPMNAKSFINGYQPKSLPSF